MLIKFIKFIYGWWIIAEFDIFMCYKFNHPLCRWKPNAQFMIWNMIFTV